MMPTVPGCEVLFTAVLPRHVKDPLCKERERVVVVALVFFFFFLSLSSIVLDLFLEVHCSASFLAIKGKPIRQGGRKGGCWTGG